MHVTLNKQKPNSGIGLRSDAPGVTTRQIELSDGPAILTTATDGSSALETIIGGIHILMSGLVPEDELTRMYEEMKD